MRRLVLATAVVLCAAGCSSASAAHSSGVLASSPSSSPSATPGSAPTVRTLAVGQTVTVYGATLTSVARYQVTVTAFKTATSVTDPADGYTAKAQAGKVIGCISFKIANVGTTASDLWSFTMPHWEGASGQVANADLPLGASCAGLGQTATSLSSAPNPAPGQFATGSTMVEFPAGAGSLVFDDRAGSQLFKVPVPAAG